MTALFDLDIFLFRIVCTPKDFIQCIDSLESWVDSINKTLEVDDYKLILSGSNNFRKEISSTYKSNRKKEKPPLHQELREYAITNMGAIVAEGEADDLIGILHNDDTVIISTDKDMNQLGGKIYNFVKKELVEIPKEDSIYYFWEQMLVGDTADFVQCIKGVGPVKAKKLLGDGNYKEVVQEQYKKQFGDDWFTEFDKNARLLFIQRSTEKDYYNYA